MTTPFDPLKRLKTTNSLLPTTGSAGPRPGDITHVAANLGIPGGLAQPEAGVKVFHSPVQPGLVQPTPAAPVTAYGAGQATRDVVGAGVGVIGEGAKTAFAPHISTLRAAGEFGRGLFGAAPAVQGGGGGGAAAVPRPQFGNVVGQSDTVPLRNPAQHQPVIPEGVPRPLGAVPGFVPGMKTINGQPGGLASSVNAQGNNVYDNASIQRLDARNASQASGGGVQAQSFGSLALPTAAPLQAQPQLSVNLPRPASAGSPYALHEARDANAALLSKLDSQSFANSLAVNRGSRSARALQGDINGQMVGLSNAGLGSATSIAGGDRDAAIAVNLAGVNQQGENQRALLADTGDTNRANIAQVGLNARTQFTTLADLQKPQTITDANGNVLSLVGNTAIAITADGNPVRVAKPNAEGAITPAIQLDALTKQLAAESSALQPNQDRVGALQQQISVLMPTSAAPSTSTPPANHIAMLRADPKVAAKFDEHYGVGAAARYLTGGSK
jgi:hypothetical protein